MSCQKCGGQNREGAIFCSSCGATLQPVQQSAGDVTSRATATAPPFPTMRTESVPGSGKTTKHYAQGKNAFTATFASILIPTGGQLYNGDMKKVGAVWFAYAIFMLLCFTGFGAYVAIPAFFLVWFWTISDARQVAKRTKPLW